MESIVILSSGIQNRLGGPLFTKLSEKKKKRKLLRVEIVGLRKNNVKETQQGLTDFIV